MSLSKFGYLVIQSEGNPYNRHRPHHEQKNTGRLDHLPHKEYNLGKQMLDIYAVLHQSMFVSIQI